MVIPVLPRILAVLAVASSSGCNLILGIEDLSGPAAPPDGTPGVDGPPVQDTIVVDGNVQLFDLQMMRTVTAPNLEFVRLPDRSIAGSTQGDDTGRFSIALDTRGAPLVGYFRFSAPADPQAPVLSFSYIPSQQPLVSSQQMDLVTLSRDFVKTASESVGEPQVGPFAFIQVVGVGQPQDGVVIDAEPPPMSRIYYANDALLPDPNLTSTGPSGVVYLFNGSPGPTTISAPGGGMGTAVIDFDNNPGAVHLLPLFL